VIVSGDNSRLKLVRKLQSRKWREREGAFVTEGEDLLAAGRAAGVEPLDVLVPADSSIEGTEVEPDLLDGVSSLGSGTRVIAIWRIPDPGGRDLPPQRGEIPATSVYLHGVADPGNVGTIVRTALALAGARVVLGPGSADAWSPKAVRAGMGAHFAAPPLRGALDATPTPRLALLAHGGEPIDDAIRGLGGVGTLCLGSERDGLPGEVAGACDASATIDLRGDAESLNVAAAAAIGLQRICSLGAAAQGTPDDGSG
jgi:TrmH family RNA methyltransferase